MRTKTFPFISSLMIAAIATSLPVFTTSAQADEPRIRIEAPRIEVPRDVPQYERGARGDLDYSMARLHESINRMNDVLHEYRADEYGRLKDEINSFNSRVDSFQGLVDHHERTSVLRDAFAKVEEAAALIDQHMRSMDASRRVNDAWQDIGAAYHRVSDDISYRSASER